MTAHLLIGWTMAVLGTLSMTLNFPADFRVTGRDKTGTSMFPRNVAGSQTLAKQALASLAILIAEGTRFELATGCPAPHFQCGR